MGAEKTLGGWMTRGKNEDAMYNNDLNLINDIVIWIIKPTNRIKCNQKLESKMSNKIKIKNTTINNNVNKADWK